MLNDQLRERLTTRFSQLDVDCKGYVEEGDLARLASHTGDALVPADRPALRDDLIAGYARLWELLIADADRACAGRITLDEYLAAMDGNVLASPENYEGSVGRIVGALFRALDADDDGHLDRAELGALCAAYDVGQPDGAGPVSQAEVLGAARDHHYGAATPA